MGLSVKFKIIYFIKISLNIIKKNFKCTLTNYCDCCCYNPFVSWLISVIKLVVEICKHCVHSKALFRLCYYLKRVVSDLLTIEGLITEKFSDSILF